MELANDSKGFVGVFIRQALRGETIDDGRAHIGLENSRKRMQMLYGSDQKFELENDPGGGAIVRIQIPLEPNSAANA